MRASSPIAVLFEPSVFALNASSPIATFSSPEVKLGMPVTAPSSEKEYKERLPAIEVFPTKMAVKTRIFAFLSFKNI